MAKQTGSESFNMDVEDWKKIGKGALIAFAGAALVQIGTYISSGVAFDWQIWLVGAVSVGINAGRKYLVDNS